MRLPRRWPTWRAALRLLLLALTLLVALPAGAVILTGGPPKTGVDNFGRLLAPPGRLSELGTFVTGSALTPDGRFLWTVGAGRVANDILIVRTADGKVIQTLDAPGQALEGGIAIAPDGGRAYVSDTHDEVGVRTFTIDRRTGRATPAATIPLPPPSGAPTPDDFPPRTPGAKQSYAAGMAVSPDGRTLVVAENLADAAAVVELASRRVTQVPIKPNSPPGLHALPHGVAIIGSRAYVADEGDGTIATFDLAAPGTVATYTPQPAAGDPVPIDATKTHPFQIIASRDGRHLYVSETNADRVLILDPADLGAPAGVIYVRRPEGLGTAPTGMALSPDGRTLYVADANENVVRAVALSSRRVGGGAGARFVRAGDSLALIPTGIYPDRVSVSPTGQLDIVSAEGVGPGPTGNSDTGAPGYGDPQQDSIRMLSTLQTLALSPTPAAADRELLALGRGGAQAAVPLGARAPAPAGSPVVGPDGGPSRKIKYVFYVVAENKTYDAYLGDLTRDPRHPLVAGSQPLGNGDPCLAIFPEFRSLPRRRDGAPCPQSRARPKDLVIRDPGMRADGTPLTPNQHTIARQFVVLDNLHADSTTSDDGHDFTASGYADDYELRGTEANNGPSPRPFDLIYPQAQPPKGFLFDLLAESGVSFFNYGEAVSGTLIPDAGLSPSEQSTRQQVMANSDYANYPSSAAIDTNPVSGGTSLNVNDPSSLAATGTERVDDSNQPGELFGQVADNAKGQTVPTRQSRLQYFENRFASQVNSAGCLASPGDPHACNVPQFNYLVLPNNHTAGTTPGRRTPDALVRDNDLAIGQLAEVISHSPIWPYAAILVMQDDPQDGADHLDAHRITGALISPYARHQAVDSTLYDQAGMIHTAELILGLRPAYLQDALARPLFNAFTSRPDLTPFNAVPISQALLDEVNPRRGAMADTSARQRWVTDRVAPRLVNRITWAYRYGSYAACPRGFGDPCARADKALLGKDG